MVNKTIKINLNDWVKVKLTDLGKEIYYHQFDDVIKAGAKIKPSFPRVDEQGFSYFQLWGFMELYGKHLGNGYPNVIEPLDIYTVNYSSVDEEKKIF